LLKDLRQDGINFKKQERQGLDMSKKKVVFVVGPTASGKTGLAINLAKQFCGEVISADSMQIYKGIHIASAAPDKEEMQGIPHHLLEFVDRSVQFSVADYVKLAKEKINEVASKGSLPVVAGGTGLYITSLLDNTCFIPEKVNPDLRADLETEFDSVGAEEMLRRLSEFDPDTAKRLHTNDRRRIIRAFEVYRTTGRTITQQNTDSHIEESEFEPLVIGITYSDRQKLYDRINRRVDIMLENGLVEEARAAFAEKGGIGGFQAIGHKELFGYFEGEVELQQAVELLKMQTRRYAKRQLTWFRRDERINWIYADEQNPIDAATELTKNFLKE